MSPLKPSSLICSAKLVATFSRRLIDGGSLRGNELPGIIASKQEDIALTIKSGSNCFKLVTSSYILLKHFIQVQILVGVMWCLPFQIFKGFDYYTIYFFHFNWGFESLT